ncbi:hypothetical protein QR680_005340 [Steinernema hermaphroditum]|uniref:NTR domain-containing protein n=1 Tax=Steinernema hermaphroditum TaxID=289476 RepID=A0AA39HT23_9BILA|nr:hypothetical protein QR680_005340 [Steinernema hermaphroditum]
MLRTLLLVVVVCCVFAFGCDCPSRADPKEKFCKSDVVGVFKVVKGFEHLNGLRITYVSLASRVFKNKNDGTHPNSITFIVTNSQSTACGVTWLKEGEEYLLNGSYDHAKRTLDVSTCGQIAPTEWQKVPADIKKALEEGSYAPCPSPKQN